MNVFLMSHHPATFSSLVVAVTHSLSRSVCWALGYDSRQPFVVFLYVFHLMSHTLMCHIQSSTVDKFQP